MSLPLTPIPPVNPVITAESKSVPLPPLVKQSATYKLFVPKKVEEKIRYLIRKYPHTEWSGVLFYRHTGNFEDNNLEIHCEDLFPMDLGTTGWTEFQMSSDVTAYIADNLDLFDCDTGLIHSHHTMGAFFSGQDTRTLQTEGNDTHCFVSLIVDTKGTYQAAITRKVHRKREVVVKNLGSSYEFFGEGEWTLDPYNGQTTEKTVEESIIEYFMLDVEIEPANNPLDYLDARFAEIEAQKKPITNVIVNTPMPDKGNDFDKDKEFFSWIREKKDETNEPYLFDKETMDSMVEKWYPDPILIHKLVVWLVTSSLITNVDIDLKQWIVRHMVRKYDEIFEDADEFDRWADAMVEFITFHYNDPTVPAEILDDWDSFQAMIAQALIDEIGTFPSNKYIEHYVDLLKKRAYE